MLPGASPVRAAPEQAAERLGPALAAELLHGARNRAHSCHGDAYRPISGRFDEGSEYDGYDPSADWGQWRTFVFDRSLSGYEDAYSPGSFFNLYDNGAFVLEYPAVATDPGYFGAYTEANGAITFAWEGWNIAGPWGATGTLNGDSLAVNFNDTMQGTDFVAAVYTLQQTAGSHRRSRLLVRQGEEPRRALVDQKLSPQGSADEYHHQRPGTTLMIRSACQTDPCACRARRRAGP
jgi:hypothetical protein